MSLDFIEEALSSGLRLNRVFTIPETSDPRLRRMFDKMFGPRERQLAFLSTVSYSIRILHRCVFNYMHDRL